MKIAVINEVSASSKNADILAALTEFSAYAVYNVGMTSPKDEPELTYIQTGLMGAALLKAGVCDLVIGGCGTGQGFLNSVMQYPGVFCGLITNPLDAWLFMQINAGNCVSLALNKGYGWAGDVNLRYIFRELFRDPPGAGYPLHRSESQAESRRKLSDVSDAAHRTMPEILDRLDDGIKRPLIKCGAFLSLLEEAAQSSDEGNEIYRRFTKL